MILLIVLFFGILLTVNPCTAENIKTVDGKEYRDAKITRAEPDGLMITFSGGVLKVPFTELPKDLQEKYHYDPQAAANFRTQLDAAERSRVQAIAVARQRRTEELAQTPAATNTQAPLVAGMIQRTPAVSSVGDTLSRVETGDDLRSIPSFTLTQYEDQKLRLIGKIVRIIFSMRDTNPRELKGALTNRCSTTTPPAASEYVFRPNSFHGLQILSRG